jgi:hypothetical protein
MIACIINFSSLTYDNPLTSASSVLSLTIFVFLALAFVLETYVIYKHRGSYDLSHF